MQPIQKLARIDREGVLAGYKWPDGLPGFRRQNVIYGWNGTGKTTISRLLAQFDNSSDSTADLEIDLVVEQQQVSGGEYLSRKPSVHVFNRDYVEQNIAASQHGTMPPVYTLGKAKINEKERRTEIERLLPEANEELKNAEARLTRSRRDYKKHLIDHASEIKRQLHSAGGNRFNNYNRGHYERLSQQMADDPSIRPSLLSETDIEALRAKIQQSPLDALLSPTVPIPDFTHLIEVVSSLTATSVVAIKLEQLQDDPTLSSWVRDGLRIHRDRGGTVCLFCEQSLVSERLERLGAHFSEAFEHLQDSIQSTEDRVIQQRSVLSEVQFPARAELYPDLQQRYAECMLQLQRVLDEALSFLGRLQTLLEDKKTKAFEVLELECEQPSSCDSELAALVWVIEKHNARCSDYGQQIEDARTRIEWDYVVRRICDYEHLVGSIESADEDITTRRAALESLQDEAQIIRHALKEHHSFADALNRELEKYLGHPELRLSASEDGYEIQRSGGAAEKLSEGETTAITLLYFLSAVTSHESGTQECIVVLDDPVTSLDNSALHLASQYIRQSVRDCGQLFLLTHNFAFFRQVKSWLGRSAKGRPGMRDWNDVGFYMLECRRKDGSRRASLIEMDSLLYRFDTEYHFLFAELYRAYVSPEKTTFSELYLLPNAARRLLEMFFAFKKPKVSRQLATVIEQSAFETGRKERLARFLHAQSHNSFVGGDDYEFVALAETPAVINDVLELIEATDAEHYGNMVELVQGTLTKSKQD